MPDPKDIDRDLREYLEKESHLRREDRLAYLRNIFDKYFGLTKMDHMVDYYDLQNILGSAKTGFVKQNLPMSISGRRVGGSELANIAVIEATVSYMNSHNLLKRLMRLDYRE